MTAQLDRQVIAGTEAAFGSALKGYRLAARLTQEGLADRAGISLRSLQALESGTNRPRKDTVQRLVSALQPADADRICLLRMATPVARRRRVDPLPASVAPLPALPVPPTALLGRDAETAAIGGLLWDDHVRLITLTGPGGIGKTRLALAVASLPQAEMTAEVAFVDLTPLTDPALVLPTIARTLGVIKPVDQALQPSLALALGGRRLVVVLDNCEHLTAAGPEIAGLLACCPGLQVLATSRVPLRLRGERLVTIPPLALPNQQAIAASASIKSYAAIDLFVQRARALRGDFALTAENKGFVAAICARLEGVPLAIELAAARSAALPPRALLERFETPAAGAALNLLTGGAQDLPARQRTIRDTIAWSYGLLSVAERTLFRRLSVFAGGFTLQGAEVVCKDEDSINSLPGTGDVFAGLDALVAHSLLRMEEQIDGSPRFTMLETIREYGYEELTAAGDAASLRRRHAAYFLAFADEARPHLHYTEQVDWLDRLDREIDNLRITFGWCIEQGAAGDADVVGRGQWAFGSLLRFWLLRQHRREGQAWAARLLAFPAVPAFRQGRARALRAAGMLEVREGVVRHGLALCEEAVELCRELDNRLELAHALLDLGMLQSFLGPWRPAAVGTGHAPLDFDAERGERQARTEQYAGGADAAVNEALDLYHEARYPSGITGSFGLRAHLALLSGDQASAEEYAARSLAASEVSGDRWYAGVALEALAGVARARGDLVTARARLEQKQCLDHALSDREGIWNSVILLGDIAQEAGDAATAYRHYRAGLMSFREMVISRPGILLLAGLACLAVEAHQPARALRIASAAEALARTRGATPIPQAQARIDQVITLTREELAEGVWEAEWAAGQIRPLEQTIADALAPEPPARRGKAGATTALRRPLHVP